ncbi:retron system putative HNH endonuclease [Halarcobacter anaerophilus]|uniref:retron system putative HNH endonuclease n=1 Tax=Halarcobacter anaerophilus TaxID=877500 RepID=UPI0005C977A0|nr:retron system putative HNH endonuclease [Halarcobacter anaerophilus]
MKYIQKTDEPEFFTVDTKELRKRVKTELNKSEIWESYKEKKVLKKYILENEQNWLCGYCESKVTLDDAHLEHIKPKSMDYENLTFDYRNLMVSCNGKCHTESSVPLTCGHKKGDNFEEDKFLNPTIIQNIRDYFVYTDNGYIGSSSLSEEKSKYTLNLLQLNTFGNNLPEARKIALKKFRNSVNINAQRTKKGKKVIAKILLNKENLAFISFLRFQYKNLIEGDVV